MSDDTPDLKQARAEVLATIAGSPLAHNPPRALAAAPLRALPPELEAKLADRARGTEAPSGHVWQRVVVPSALLAVLDAAGIAAGVATGRTVAAIGAAVLFVPLAALAIFGARFAMRDPLRLTAADRRTIAAAGRWTSKQSWTGPLATCEERGLVIAAVRAAERIAANPAWQTGRIDEQRLRLDLGAELDQIDEQAYRIALARHDRSADAATDAAWDTTLNRVAALTAYAGQLGVFAQGRTSALAGAGDPVRETDLLAGQVRDELAMTQLAALTAYLLHDPGS